MMLKKRFDFNSAYAQLILIVFIPITLLAAVGGYLVKNQTTKAIESEQRTLATAALVRYEPVVKALLPVILDHENTNAASNSGSHSVAPRSTLLLDELDNVQNNIRLILNSMNNDQHIQRVSVINAQGDIIASSNSYTGNFFKDAKISNPANNTRFMEGIPTSIGTAYGLSLGQYDANDYWLLIDMDNEPLVIATLQIWMALVTIGLFTLLMLLLSLNIYAKRWIAPVYDLRLHLQQVSPNNMYRPVNINSSGELNLLQQDLVKTLRRIFSEFQDLKDHAEQTEEDLRDAFDEMEMQNILIREARDQAISSSQAKSAFLANISHELRTPLNSIDGFINLLARHGELSAEQNLYVQTIRKSSAHLLALINDVLDFSKIEAGKLILDRHEFNLYSVIYDVMDMLTPLAAEKGLRMAVFYYNDVPNTIIGDALRVKQVLTNLVGNAIKFTSVGEVVVRVGIDDVDATLEHDIDTHNGENSNSIKSHNSNDIPTGNMIHIAIQDTGYGISDTAKSQLFRSFSQADPSITRQYGGTGLGLVISKQLTRLMGGKIGFYNNAQEDALETAALSDSAVVGHASESIVAAARTPKSGATFWFSIPAHVDVENISELGFGTYSDNEDNAISLPELRPFKNKNRQQSDQEELFAILVWINHTASLQVFMAAVRPLNVKVTIAKSLAGALERLKEKGNQWDWVLIDGGNRDSQEDRAALLKQIRLHYQGKLAIYGYQVALDAILLERYKAAGLYQPLDKRQLYRLLDRKNSHVTTVSTPQTWQGVKVLAVDDHLPNLLVLDALLSELGIEVMTVNSGYDAIDIVSKQLLQHETVDMIFMDVQMPRMSGDEAVRQIRQFELEVKSTESIPIIALTAQALSDGKNTLIEAGFDDYVGKPISRPQLLQILQRWLGKGGFAPASHLIHDTVGDIKENTVTNTASNMINGLYAIDLKTDGMKTENIEPNDQSSAKLPIIDWKDALLRSVNKPDLAKQLLTMMQDSVTDELDELQAAWEMRDREQLAQIAHRILGASRYTGVPQIRKSSRDFEDKCQLNVQHTTPAQFKMLEAYYNRLVESLKNLQDVDLQIEIEHQAQRSDNKILSENDMTWKMI